MWKNIILDWSGTVVDDLAYVWESTNYVLVYFGRKPITFEEFRNRFTLPWIDFYKKNLSEINREELNRVFWKKMQEVQPKISLHDGAMDFFRYCNDHNLPIFILSTVDSESFWGQSDRFGTSHLIRKAYVGVEDKRAEIGRVLGENQLDPAETIMVGDMIHDIEAARKIGITACAVLWGFDPKDKLAGAKPDLMIRDLGELQAILRAQSASFPRA